MVSVLTSADMCWLLSPPLGVVCVVSVSANQRTELLTLHQSEDSMQLSPSPKGPGEWVQQPLDITHYITSITLHTLSSASNRYNTGSGER